MPVQPSTTVNDILKSYNLVNGQESGIQEIKRTQAVSYADCKMFYLKSISLLIKSRSSNTAKLGLYQLDSKTSPQSPASWELITRPSVPLLDLKSFIPVSYKGDGVIVVSIVNQQSTSDIKFHIFSLSKAEKRKSASSHIRNAANYQIQSCATLSNFIYCSLLQPEVGAYIYKFDIALLLRKETRDDENIISPNCKWFIENSTLQNCFISVHEGVIFTISVFTNSNKSIMEIKRLLGHTEISSVEHKLEFPRVVKVVTASVIADNQNPLIAVMYHDERTKKCYIKRVAISPV